MSLLERAELREGVSAEKPYRIGDRRPGAVGICTGLGSGCRGGNRDLQRTCGQKTDNHQCDATLHSELLDRKDADVRIFGSLEANSFTQKSDDHLSEVPTTRPTIPSAGILEL